MNNYIVYLHKNKITQQVYIGITSQTVNARWRKNGTGYKGQPKFWSAIETYGWDNFEHLILATHLTVEEASRLEKQLIQIYNSVEYGYNSDLGGAVTNHSIETIEKIRSAMTGKSHTIDTKQKISQSKNNDKIKVICIETNQEYESLVDAMKQTGIDKSSISKACYGTAHTAGGYHWQFRNQPHAPSEDKRFRRVECINTGIIYESISAAARATNSDVSNIKKVCDGKYKTTNKLKWRWIDV